MNLLGVIVTAALLCFVVNGSTFGIDDDDIMDCFDYTMCDSGKVQDFRDVFGFYKAKAMDHAMHLIRENTGWSEAKNDDDTWANMPNKYCSNSEERKKELFSTLGMEMTDFWRNVCDDGNEEECSGIEDACEEFSKVLADNIAKGQCGKAAKALKAVKLPAYGR